MNIFPLGGVQGTQHPYCTKYSRGFCAGSLHTTKLCSRLYSIGTEFYSAKLKKSVFEIPFGGLRGNVRTPSIARWKACGRFTISHISAYWDLDLWAFDLISMSQDQLHTWIAVKLPPIVTKILYWSGFSGYCCDCELWPFNPKS